MAWSIVGVGTSVEVTATAHALTVPAGVAAGDLLVACIASRIASTTSITLPTGGEWTLVSEQKANNILSTGSAVASAMMAYCVRGASNPNLTFTHPAAPAPALGRIVAYRGGATPTASAKDTQTSSTTAISITAVNLTGMTTTVADDLIVAMLAGGQEAAWSVFKSANAPTTASGATDTTTAPSTTTWIERADVQTTTSNDTSLGIFDAIKTAAGATGNFTATASVAASHALVAGAFKILPTPTADAWNLNDKSANITLSASDKTATSTSGSIAGVRSTTQRTNGAVGKYYAEGLLVATGSIEFGIKSKSATITATTDACYVEYTDILIGTSTVGELSSTNPVDGDVICIAWDSDAELIWFRLNNGLWNNDASANPATGTNGIDVSTLPDVDHCLWFWSFESGRSATVRTELAEYTQAVPSGFTSWMGETPPTADAWSSIDKSATITLSASDKTATIGSGTAGIRSTTSYLEGAAGKYYAEFLCNVISSTTTFRVGFADLTASLTTAGAGTFHARATGDILVQGAVNGSMGSSVASADVICAAWDAGAKLAWFRKNGNSWNNDAGADPATGTGGIDISPMADVNHALWFRDLTLNHQVTLRTELADYTQTVPSGFTSWMGETPPGSVGAAAGTSTATATASSTAASAAASAGIASVSAVAATPRQYLIGSALGAVYVSETGGRSYASAAGYISETFAAAIAEEPGVAVGSAAGTSTAVAVGAALVQQPGLAAGTSTAVAIGAGIFAAAGSAAGTSTAAATGTSTTVVSGAGSAAGISTAAATGMAVFAAAGSAAGISTTAATGASTGSLVGGAAGTSTTSAVGTGIRPVPGSAAGISTAAATGAAVVSTVGSAAGTSTAIATVLVIGSAAGTSTATATGRATFAGIGSAAGTSTAVATGVALAASPGSAAGTSTAAAISTAILAAVGNAAGTSTAPGVGASLAVGSATGNAHGVATATAVGISRAVSPGNAAGTSTAVAVGAAVDATKGDAAGISTTTAVGRTTAAARGDAAGTSTTLATGRSTAAAVGNAAGISTATATGRATGSGVGSAAGVSTCVATGVAIKAAVGSAAGTSICVATGKATVSAIGNAAGISTAIAEAAAVVAAGLVGVWDGAAWVDKPAKVWMGSAWMQKPVKTWSGSAWV